MARRMMCFICHDVVVDGDSILHITTDDGHDICVHNDCMRALFKLMKQFPKSERSNPPVRPSNVSASGLIEDFYQDGWFSVSRTLSDVVSRMRQRGFNFEKSTISHALQNYTQRNILTRQGSRGNYKYIQKKPPLSGN